MVMTNLMAKDSDTDLLNLVSDGNAYCALLSFNIKKQLKICNIYKLIDYRAFNC